MGNTTKRGILCRMESALKHSPKKKGAILSLETMLYIGILIIFAAIGIGMYNQRDSAKAAAARTEMDQIRTAVTQYNMYSNSEYTEANFDALLNKLSADDSIDGLEHGPFLTAGGKWGTSVVDPWGQQYTYDSTTGTITCTGSDPDMTLQVGKGSNSNL